MKKWMAVVAACLVAACNSGGSVSGPSVDTPEAAAPAPVAAAPVSQPVAPPPSGKTFDLWGESGKLYVRNNGSVRAEIATFRTTFDDQTTELEAQTAILEPGATLERGFSVTGCFQGDADQRGVKLIGGIFFDKQGNPFVPSQSPEKVAECRQPDPEPSPEPTPTPTPSPSPSPSPSPTPEPCDQIEFWDQSFEANKNVIKFNVHARGQGTWTLTLYATSSLSEYTNNDPDYTKDVDTDIVTKCKNGQTELKVDYGWKGHSSRYWWAVLRFNGAVKWKSAAVEHN